MALKAKLLAGQWAYDSKEIFRYSDGKILVIELDAEDNIFSDSAYTHDRELSKTNQDVLNRLYIVDEALNCTRLV